MPELDRTARPHVQRDVALGRLLHAVEVELLRAAVVGGHDMVPAAVAQGVQSGRDRIVASSPVREDDARRRIEPQH